MRDDRPVAYPEFISLEEVIFGEYVFIKIVCTSKEYYIEPVRVREMLIMEV